MDGSALISMGYALTNDVVGNLCASICNFK